MDLRSTFHTHRFVVLAAALAVILLQATASAAPAPAGKRLIEYYGDSTIWGYRSGIGGQVAITAPAAFTAALPAAAGFEVRNEGVNGTTSCQLLDGSDGKHLPWPQQMKRSQAHYVLVNFAINDQWRHDLPTYRACLSGLARTARQYGKQMIFETPNPTRDSGPTGLDMYVKAMKEVALQEGVPLIDQYQYLTDFLNGQSPLAICPDGLHPSEPVYIMKGRFAARMFLTLLARK